MTQFLLILAGVTGGLVLAAVSFAIVSVFFILHWGPVSDVAL